LHAASLFKRGAAAMAMLGARFVGSLPMSLQKDFARRIRPHVDRELAQAAQLDQQGNPLAAFRHLERAHVLGQSVTRQHVRVHAHMLRWALRHRRPVEILGQAVRVLAAAIGTGFGLVPIGNTGGANVPLMRRLPIEPELAAIIADASGESANEDRSHRA
jgi:hypothetical protein